MTLLGYLSWLKKMSNNHVCIFTIWAGLGLLQILICKTFSENVLFLTSFECFKNDHLVFASARAQYSADRRCTVWWSCYALHILQSSLVSFLAVWVCLCCTGAPTLLSPWAPWAQINTVKTWCAAWTVQVTQTSVQEGVKKMSRFICQRSHGPIVECERAHLRHTISRTVERMWTH